MTAILHPLTRERMSELLDAMCQVRIAVVGDAMLDRYLLGDSERISPEAPVPIVTVDEERTLPGGAANVAANLAAIGASCHLVAITGDDPAGDALREALAALGIPTNGLITVAGRPTTTKTRIVARGQQVVRIDLEVSNPPPARHREELLAATHLMLGDADALLIADYNKGVIDAVFAQAMVAAARDAGIPVVVDPKQRHFFDYAGATVFKPNRRELEAAFGTHVSGGDADLEAARMRLGVEHMLLTLGADGMALASPEKILRRTPSIARGVFDVSGAGDTVTAWLGAALAAGAAIGEAAWLANLAAGVKVGKRGTATVSPTEVRVAWEDAVGGR